jgi:hypothetical protein
MSRTAKFAVALARPLAVALCAVASCCSSGVCVDPSGSPGHQFPSVLAHDGSRFTLHAQPPAEEHCAVAQFVTGFDGDHSLNTTTVAEHVFAQYSLYSVRVQFASGAEQSFTVTAPPGGLQPEMRDMSGDSVPNDLVLTSRLLRSPLVVLLNDGHDHFTLAISPDLFASNDGRASGPHESHGSIALMSSSFKAKAIANRGDLYSSRPQENRVSRTEHSDASLATHSFCPGRAPPVDAPQNECAS